MSGDLAVVSARHWAPRPRAVWRTSINSAIPCGIWTAALTSADATAGDNFGAAVAIDGDLVVVGDPDGNATDPVTTAGAVDAGEAFVFNLSNVQAPVLEARLTETDGLSEADAAAVGQQAGDQFGEAVAIAGNDTAGYYVVVVPPNYGEPVGAGAAYVFYRLPDQGSGTGPSWTRSTGSSGSGQLTPASPQGARTATSSADEFGGSVVVGDVSAGGGRVVIGLEGYNQTTSNSTWPTPARSAPTRPAA